MPAGSCSTARTSRACRCIERVAARARALLPDHLDPAGLLGAGECRARGAGARRLELPLLRRRRARDARSTSRRWRCLDRVGLDDRAGVPAGRLSHGEKRALELAIALATRAEAAAARRAAGRHRATRRRERLVETAAAPEGPLRHPAGRARHGRGVRARRPHLVLVYGRIIATGTPERDPRRSGGARRLSRRGGAGLMLSVDNLRCRLRRGPGAVRRRPRRRRRRGRDAARPQRHGQDDDDPHHHGPAARRPAARVRFDGDAIDGPPPYRIAQAGIGLVPEGRQIFPTLTVEENLSRPRPRASAPRAGRWQRVYDLLPAPGGAARQSRHASSPAASSRCWRSAAR